MQTLASLWRSYEREVLPANAPAVQIRETRRAFYAGAEMLLMILKSAPDDEGEAIQQIEAIDQEFEAFKARVGKDY